MSFSESRRLGVSFATAKAAAAMEEDGKNHDWVCPVPDCERFIYGDQPFARCPDHWIFMERKGVRRP